MLVRNGLRLMRGEPADLDALSADVRASRPLALANHQTELARQLDIQDALARFRRGDVAAAHADLLRLWQAQPPGERSRPTRRITGQVVDAGGRPVAGARIAATTRSATADPVGIDSPDLGVERDRDDDLRIATSDAAGRFAIEDAAAEGTIVAELGDRRSMPAVSADRVVLALEPTRRVTGKVDLARLPATRVGIHALVATTTTALLELTAPVAPDGSFTIPGAPVHAFQIGAALNGQSEIDRRIELRSVPAGATPVDGLVLSVEQSQRVIDVIIRSTAAAPLEGAEVFVLAGKPRIASINDLIRYRGSGVQTRMAIHASGGDLPVGIADQVRPDDLVAHIEHAGLGSSRSAPGGSPATWATRSS